MSDHVAINFQLVDLPMQCNCKTKALRVVAGFSEKDLRAWQRKVLSCEIDIDVFAILSIYQYVCRLVLRNVITTLEAAEEKSINHAISLTTKKSKEKAAERTVGLSAG